MNFNNASRSERGDFYQWTRFDYSRPMDKSMSAPKTANSSSPGRLTLVIIVNSDRLSPISHRTDVARLTERSINNLQCVTKLIHHVRLSNMKIPKNKTQIPQTVVSWRRSPGIMYHFFLFSSSLPLSLTRDPCYNYCLFVPHHSHHLPSERCWEHRALGWLDPEPVIGPRRSMKCVRNGTNGNIVQIKRLLKHFSSALLS